MPCRYADRVTALLVATSDGLVGCYLLTDELRPCWCDGLPQHQIDDNSTAAVRLQVGQGYHSLSPLGGWKKVGLALGEGKTEKDTELCTQISTIVN